MISTVIAWADKTLSVYDHEGNEIKDFHGKHIDEVHDKIIAQVAKEVEKSKAVGDKVTFNKGIRGQQLTEIKKEQFSDLRTPSDKR